MTRPLLQSAVLAALLLLPAPLAVAARETQDLKTWAAGPIRYIAQHREIKTYKALEADGDRVLYIERFWARRDPTPGTLGNEYRELFWERVREANRLFLDSHKPGWKTDRGKIYILYGPPTEKEEELHLETNGLPAAGRGLIRWIYQGRPGGRMDLNPIVVVPFVRVGGEYRLSHDPKLASVFFDALAIKEKRHEGMDRFLEMMSAPRKTPLSVMLDLGKMQEVPPHSQVLLETVETSETYKTHPLRVDLGRFKHPDEPGTLAVVTVDVSHVESETGPSVIARFVPDDRTRQTRMLGEDSFHVVERPGERLAQGRLVLDPGRYDLTVMVADFGAAATGMHREHVNAPKASNRMRFSDVTLAAELESQRYAGLATHDEPYLIGPFRVIPKIGSFVRRGDAIRLFFEVYGGAPPFRVVHQLEGRDLDGSWVRLGLPSESEQQGSAQAWELSTSPVWPEGDYRVRIEVTDSEERLVVKQVPLTIGDHDPTLEPAEPEVRIAPDGDRGG